MRQLIVVLSALTLASCIVYPEEPVQLADVGLQQTDAGDVQGDGQMTSDGALDATDANADTQLDATDANADAQLDAAGCTTPATRGAWVYRHPGSPLGTDVIVGDLAEEATAIANLQTLQIDRVYGNYGDRPITEPAIIGAWNESLHNAGIQSQLLIGDGADIFWGCRESMLYKIFDRFIEFNASVPVAQRFDALHLDIEPQQYKQGASFPTTTSCNLRIPKWPYWDDLNAGGRAERYKMLLDTFHDVRAYLDSYGHQSTEVYVDLAPWIDSSSNFDWTGVTGVVDGTDWLTQAETHVDGMTMMTYERDTAASIDSSVATEATLQTLLRVSVNAKERAPLSTTTTWADLAAMFTEVEALEQTHCGDMPVDLFNYRYLHE